MYVNNLSSECYTQTCLCTRCFIKRWIAAAVYQLSLSSMNLFIFLHSAVTFPKGRRTQLQSFQATVRDDDCTKFYLSQICANSIYWKIAAHVKLCGVDCFASAAQWQFPPRLFASGVDRRVLVLFLLREVRSNARSASIFTCRQSQIWMALLKNRRLLFMATDDVNLNSNRPSLRNESSRSPFSIITGGFVKFALNS